MLDIRERRYPAGLTQPRHAHDETTVTLVFGGSLRERVGRVEETAQSLSFVVKPTGTEHETTYGATGTHVLQIVLDEATAKPIVDADRRLAAWQWAHGGPAVPSFLALLRLVRENADRDAIIRALYDALGALDEPPADAATSGPPRWLRAIREQLDDEISPPPVQQLAESADVHPVYLARCFRRYVGCSITEYVLRRRVQRAASDIGMTAARLAVVASDTGFFDQAHMCRAFRQATGMAPSAFRALVSEDWV